MHIRIFHQYFRTPETGGSLRSYFLAREMIRNGFDVSIITATNEKNAHEASYEGIPVYYLPVYYSNHLDFRGRVRAFARFAWQAVRKNRDLVPADVNYIISTPLTTGLIGLYEKKIYGTRYFFEVGDIWPEAPIQLGFLRNSILQQLAKVLEKSVCRNASKLIGLSPGISAHLETVSGRKDVLTITNFSEPESLECSKPSDTIRNSLGIKDDEFIISYTGTIGFANQLEFLIDLACVLPEDVPVRIVIMGEGARIDQLRKYTEDRRANNRIIFLPKGSRSEVSCILGISHAVYISFASAPVLQTGCPNKFFDAIAIGRMVISNFGGWIADLISEHRIGFSYDPTQPDEALEKLMPYIRNRELLKEIAERGKLLARSYGVKAQTGDLIKEFRKIEKAG